MVVVVARVVVVAGNVVVVAGRVVEVEVVVVEVVVEVDVVDELVLVTCAPAGDASAITRTNDAHRAEASTRGRRWEALVVFMVLIVSDQYA